METIPSQNERISGRKEETTKPCPNTILSRKGPDYGKWGANIQKCRVKKIIWHKWQKRHKIGKFMPLMPFMPVQIITQVEKCTIFKITHTKQAARIFPAACLCSV
ncbi:MAG: hypothetical protein J6T80_01250 [Paludibacteraceae bacterium]|nr:hypothetical protein [Paludibacteraceae bacterium]